MRGSYKGCEEFCVKGGLGLRRRVRCVVVCVMVASC